MTLKEWNNLPQSKKNHIVNVFYWNMGESFKKDIAQEFHHNFNWAGINGTAQEGRWYELMLKNCKINKNGSIKVNVTIG